MTDPKFATRAELEAWVESKLRKANRLTSSSRLVLLVEIRRVTLAHGHLFEEAK